ncbi:hypothetical protein ACHAW5_007360 [Stephanodiscus triporus]|uniref:RING-type E3 ubiquitin transferase n=1 Tax=Stephanodiscus triporus TaxID=2934178 RepID=A0ABD3NUM8_9STRA
MTTTNEKDVGNGGSGRHSLASPSASSSSSSSSSPRPPPARPFCRFFFQSGRCRNGESCRFSHVDASGSLSREEVLRTIPCPHFASGTCRYGDRCELRHRRSAADECGGGTKGGYGEEEDDDDDDQARVCGICLEPPRSYGVLSCCDHSFCYPCLMEWRKEGSSDVSSRRVCPTCRRSSDYVVPSSYLPTSVDEKERVLRDYRVRCSSVPCKNFEFGKLGSCPFGRDCFYAHSGRNGADIKSRDKSMQELYEIRQRDRNDRTNRDMQYVADMLMMMGLRRHLGGQDREAGGGYRRRRGEIYDDDDEDDTDDDDDGGDIFFSNVLAALLREEPDFLGLFTH